MDAGSLLAVAFLVLSPGAHDPAGAVVGAAPAAASPAPAVSFASASPVLAEESPLVWTTTVVLDESPACLTRLTYQLITTSPDYLVNGVVRGTAAVEPVSGADGVRLDPASLAPLGSGHLGSGCGDAAGADSEVSLAFRLPAQFTQIPQSATLAVDDPGGPPPPATVPLTVQRLVTSWDYLWIPVICGGALALLLLVLVGLGAFSGTVRRLLAREKADQSGNGFWRRPIYASGAWSFTDSWATNIATAGTIIAGTLTAAGTVSTLLPGVQLDRFAILIAICGGIIVAAPLAFGVFNTLATRPGPMVPPNASLRFPSPYRAEVLAPGGASLTFAADASTTGQDGNQVMLKAGAAVPVPPAASIVASLAGDGVAVFPGDSTIVLKGASTVQINTEGQQAFTVPAEAVQRAPAASARPRRRPWRRTGPGPGSSAIAPAPARAVRMTTGREITLPVPTGDGVRIAAVGFVTAKVPRGTAVSAPGAAREKTFRRETSLRVPVGDNLVAADMRSVMPAAMITLFGIGAELGLLSVLAGGLSAASSTLHATAVAVVVVMALVLLGYSVVTTNTLFSAQRGSALAPESKTSYTL